MPPDTRASRRAVRRRRNCCCCCAFGVGCEERTIALPLPLLLPGCSTSVLLCPVMSVCVMFVPVFWEPERICLFSSSSNGPSQGVLSPKAAVAT